MLADRKPSVTRASMERQQPEQEMRLRTCLYCWCESEGKSDTIHLYKKLIESRNQWPTFTTTFTSSYAGRERPAQRDLFNTPHIPIPQTPIRTLPPRLIQYANQRDTCVACTPPALLVFVSKVPDWGDPMICLSKPYMPPGVQQRWTQYDCCHCYDCDDLSTSRGQLTSLKS